MYVCMYDVLEYVCNDVFDIDSINLLYIKDRSRLRFARVICDRSSLQPD